MRPRSYILCGAFLLAIAQPAFAKVPNSDQMRALVDGVILPFSGCETNGAGTTKVSGFDVVIVDDTVLQNQLSEMYKRFNKCLKFEPQNALLLRRGKNGQAQDYVDKSTGQVVWVERFEVISSNGNSCQVRWSNVYASLGGFTKVVTLAFVDNKWRVVAVKLETVS